MPSRKASSARVACARVRRASTAIFPTRSLLFTRHVQCPRLLSKAHAGVNLHEKTFQVGIAQFVILPYRENAMDQTTVRLIAGILAVVLVAIIFMRRKKKKGVAEDDF